MALSTRVPAAGGAECHQADRHSRRLTMTSKYVRSAALAGMLIGSLSVTHLVPSVGAQQSATSATDVLKKARVLDRLAEAMPAEHKGTAPGFVLDPAWPQPLPHHWVI